MLIKNKILKIIIKTDIKNDKTNLVKESLEYSTPLIPSSISWWILNVSDRTVISYFINPAANGIYSISNKFSSIYIGVFNIVSLSWTESVALQIDSKNSVLEELYNVIIKLFFIILIMMIGVIPIIYPYFIGKNFYSSYYYVPILLLGSLFNVGFGLTQSLYIGLKKTKTLAKTAMFCALINLVIDLCLVKYIGIYAAVSTMIAYFALFVYQYVDINKYYKIKLDIYSNIYMLIIFFIGIIMYYINIFLYSIIYIIISMIILIIFNYKYIEKYKKNILKRIKIYRRWYYEKNINYKRCRL